MVSIPIKPRCDENGMFGRACPACGRYFRMKLGTGLPDQSDCHCPYCNHTASHTKFWVRKQFKTVPEDPAPGESSSILVPVSVRGQSTPVKEFIESDLEQAIRCEDCGLEYSVYGLFAHCPDCGAHNTRQILDANFSLIRRLLKLSQREPAEIRDSLAEIALDDTVSAFDGFGRAYFAGSGASLTFQDIESARDRIFESTKHDIADGVSSNDWAFARGQFQIRHLIAQSGGVINAAFAKSAGMPAEAAGRKVKVASTDIVRLLVILERIADAFSR